MKAAVVIDAWKLDIFAKHLTADSFQYEQKPGVTPDTLTLAVTTVLAINLLHQTVKRASDECANVVVH